MSDAPNGKMTPEQRVKLWEKYEDTAMHFNDLILRLRTQALGGLTAIIALSGIAVNFSGGPTTSDQWNVIFGTLLFLMFAWVALGLLDLFYYHTLLLGAVDALLEIEAGTEIKLSTKIEQRFGRGRRENLTQEQRWQVKWWLRERRWQIAFYLIGLVALILAAVATKCVSLKIQRAENAPSKTLQLNVDRSPGERVELKLNSGSIP